MRHLLAPWCQHHYWPSGGPGFPPPSDSSEANIIKMLKSGTSEKIESPSNDREDTKKSPMGVSHLRKQGSQN